MSNIERLYIQLDNILENMTISDIANYLVNNYPDTASYLADSINSEFAIKDLDHPNQTYIEFKE